MKYDDVPPTTATKYAHPTACSPTTTKYAHPITTTDDGFITREKHLGYPIVSDMWITNIYIILYNPQINIVSH